MFSKISIQIFRSPLSTRYIVGPCTKINIAIMCADNGHKLLFKVTKNKSGHNQCKLRNHFSFSYLTVLFLHGFTVILKKYYFFSCHRLYPIGMYLIVPVSLMFACSRQLKLNQLIVLSGRQTSTKQAAIKVKRLANWDLKHWKTCASA